MLASWLMLTLAATPSVALLSTAPDGESTQLRFQRVGAPMAEPVAQLKHFAGTVRGALLPDGKTVAVTAQHTNPRDPSFAFALFTMRAGAAPKLLVDRVSVACPPVITGATRVVVQRGTAGPASDTMRVDALTLDEVDVVTGEVTTLLKWDGYVMFPAVVAQHELIVYRMGPYGARIDGVNLSSHAVRPLINLEPLAHDFTTDGTAMYFTLGDSVERTWNVKRLDLKTAQLTTVATGPSVALLPTVLADGRVAFAPAQGGGLVDVKSKQPIVAAHGDGFERVRWSERDQLIDSFEVPGAPPRVLHVDLTTGKTTALPTPENTWVDVAGVTP